MAGIVNAGWGARVNKVIKGVLKVNEALKPIRNYYRREVLLELPPGASFVYRSGNNMTMPLQPPPVFYAGEFSSEYTSDDVIVVGDQRSRKYVLVGALTAFRSLTHLVLRVKGRVMRAVEVRQEDIMEGEEPEEMMVLEGCDWRELLVRYAEAVRSRMHIPAFDTAMNLTGYCTWYYYYADVTEADLLENLEAMSARRNSGYKAQVIQIDDGYQTYQGDWNDQDPSWPTPLREIARRINAAGMTAGIWTMPFQASTASRVFREHPDWFVKDANDKPIVAKGWSPPPDDLWATLDTSNPAALEHLAKIFRTFHEWGYNYFKMDGLGFALVDGHRHDPYATPVSAFRSGLKAIREAVPDAFLLGCCPPFMACLGYIDGARVSPDTAARWLPIRNAMQTTVSRWWMYDRFFRCDPDTIMARQDRAQHTIGEARISTITGIMTGVSITSDNLRTIDDERFKLLERAANIRMRDVRPLFWNVQSWPQVFTGTVDGAPAVALINATEEDLDFFFEDIGLDKEREAEELLHPLGMRKYLLTLSAHDAALLVQK